ncbi:MAG: galactose-1-phosphate uridylyltransferase [Candidatus Brocadiia bacterium]
MRTVPEMAELRQDPVSGRWVIIATERAARPHDFRVPRGRGHGGFCPFCEGNEDRTPPEVYAVRAEGTKPDTPGWQVRVVPNRFPALRAEQDATDMGNGFYHAVGGHGVHEVIIESPRHITSPTEAPPEELVPVVRTYCARAGAHSKQGLSYVLLFKNVGQRAGASIEHSHSQLIAVPVLPKRVAEEMQNCREYGNREGKCLFCEIVRREREAGARVVLERDGFVVLSPYSARFPFELWILPAFHAVHFHELSDTRAEQLAHVLHEVLTRLDICLREPPYNYAVHTAPVGAPDDAPYHWHIEVIPRVTRVAGFEWGTGFYINPMEPERAAEHLRRVSVERPRVETPAPE